MTDSAKFLEPEPPGPFDPPNGVPYAAPGEPDPRGPFDSLGALPPSMEPRYERTRNGRNTPTCRTDAHTAPQGAAGPCADCQRNAAIAGYIGVVLGVAFGVTAAYLILKNRLAPRD
jgi:hypothetical protein